MLLTGHFQQGQERHGGGDLSDHRADLVLDRFLRLLSGRAVKETESVPSFLVLTRDVQH